MLRQTIKLQRISALVLLVSLISVCATSKAYAQGFAPTLTSNTNPTSPIIPNNMVPMLPAGETPPDMPVPPPGDGNNPMVVTPGDTGQPGQVATNQADTTNGTIFSSMNGTNRTTVYVYRQGTGAASGTIGIAGGTDNPNPAARGRRMVMTLRPDTLSAQQITDINGILGIDMLGGQTVIQANATNQQLALINASLAPSADDPSRIGQQVASPYFANGWTQITQDPTAAQYAAWQRPGEQELFIYAGMPFIRTMCRYLVLTGVVFATVKIALAAYAISMGHPYAGSRVIAAVSGLALLLCAYTIWKIVTLNTMHLNSTTFTNNPRPQQGAGTTPLAKSNLPIVPTAPTGRPNRSGVPVIPLSGN